MGNLLCCVYLQFRWCARSNDMKIVHSRDGQCNTKHSDDSKLINLVSSHINFCLLGHQISTFLELTQSKPNVCFVGLQTEIETTSVGNILWPNAIFMCNIIWLIPEECFIVKLSQVSYLISYYNTLRKNYQNFLKSHFNSPGWEKRTPLNVQEYLVGK